MSPITSEAVREAIRDQLEAHFANFVYVLLGLVVMWCMYFMSDCMYTKETGLIILGWIGVLISGKRSESTGQKDKPSA
jgi:hypothetical protein